MFIAFPVTISLRHCQISLTPIRTKHSARFHMSRRMDNRLGIARWKNGTEERNFRHIHFEDTIRFRIASVKIPFKTDISHNHDESCKSQYQTHYIKYNRYRIFPDQGFDVIIYFHKAVHLYIVRLCCPLLEKVIQT